MKKNTYLCHVIERSNFNKSYLSSYSYFLKNSKYKKILYLFLDNKKKNNLKKNYLNLNQITELSKSNKIDFLLSVEFKIKNLFSIFKIKNISRKTFYLLNNTIFYYRSYKFKGKTIFFFKNFINIIKFSILKFFQFINVIPKVDFVFYSTQFYLNKNDVYKFSFQKNLPLNIYGYDKIVRVNSFASEFLSIKNKNNIKKKKYIVFLDGCFNHKDRSTFCEGSTLSQERAYYKLLRKLLNRLSKLNNSKSIFLAHPQTNVHRIKKYLKDIEIVKNETLNKILNSSFVLFHESSSVNYAILANKKIISLHSPLLGKWMNFRTKTISSQIKCPTYDLEKLCNLEEDKLVSILKKPYFKNIDYIKNNLLIMNKKKKYKEIIKPILQNKKIINKCLFDED